MNANSETKIVPMDAFKWLLVGLIIVGTVAGSIKFSDYSLLIRAGAMLLAMLGAIAVAATTEKGRRAIEYLKATRIELRKIVWPTTQESMQTTLLVVVTVIIVALLLWGLDGILVRLTAWITGQGA